MYNAYLKPFLKKIKRSLTADVTKLNLASPRFYFYDETEKSDLLIFDDFLPDLLGSWRAVELSAYLKEFDKAKLICFLSFYNEKYKSLQFEEDKKLFVEKFGIRAKEQSICRIDHSRPININTKLAYCLFYHNIRSIYPVLEKYQVPFVFTLFPGGDFAFYNKECDAFLKKISASPLLKKIIVTQQSTYNYLVDRKIFTEDQLALIFGGCFPTSKYQLKGKKTYYKRDRAALNICFVSGKYIDHGLDKGFDIFCHTAYKLCKKYNFIKFHVVGNFTKDDLMFEIAADKIFFYGIQGFEWFADFYADKDVIISPVRPFVLQRGAFDGFPTGGTVDAALYGVLMMSSDPLEDNSLAGFSDWNDMIIAESNSVSIINAIEKLIEKPSLIESIANSGQKKCLAVYSEEEQIQPRIKLLKETIKKICNGFS